MDTPSHSSNELLTGNGPTTNLVLCSHEFPCDDLQGLFRCLQRHSKSDKFPLLGHFLTKSTAVLRAEALKLPQQQQDLLPYFHSILNLAGLLNGLKRGPLGVAIEGVLLCVLEIGMLIGHFEGQGLEYNLPQSQTTVSGLSIGLFAAAAISISSSLLELSDMGAEAVRMAFRFCLHVDEVSQMIEPRSGEGAPRSWAYVVTGLSVEDVQKELDQYNSAKFNHELTKVRISHSEKHSVGVTGPPSRLKDLFQHSHVLRHSKHSPLGVHGGLCHATGVYGEEDVRSIIGALDGKLCTHAAPMPLLSPYTGMPFPANNARHLFELICQEALTKPLYQDNLINGILKSISGAPECQTFFFRTSIISNAIFTEIESNSPTTTMTRCDLIDWADTEFGTTPSSTKHSKLAVVGMACRMPGGANNTELFWKLMEEGRDVHTKVPADRFDLETHYDPTGQTENATESPFGNFIENPGFFDAGFFNMSPREASPAEQTDPMHRLALVTAYEALEMAGFSPNRTPSTKTKRVGTFYGVASDDYREVNAGQTISTYGIPGGERAFANGRINYFFKFGGPSFNIDTACSSGGAAINAACSALWSNDADTVIAGGLNIISNPDIYCMLSKGHFLSKTGQCKVWDKTADGYCRADGIGSVVIKRLEDAEADNDNILGVIVAAATNHSAEAVSITHPHAGAQRYNYSQVMQNAGVDPLDVSYVELHGTGTQAGDAVESESVADIFAPLAPVRHAGQKLHLGAVKSNIGHGEAAAGVASLIKVLLAFKMNQIPRNIGITTKINPVVAKHIARRNMEMVTKNTDWPRIRGKKRYAVANSFGAHGGNTTFLLEDSPEKMRRGLDPRSAYPVTLSAKSKLSLRGNMKAMMHLLDSDPNINLGDLSYTTCARRIHHHTRIAASVTNTADLRKFLEMTIEGADGLRPIPATAPTVGFAFSGQGAFYNGIGSQMFRDFPPYRKEILKLDRIVQQFNFPSVIQGIEGGSPDVQSPIVSHLTIVVTEIALVTLWELLGIKPSVVIGHSLGEYAALVCAHILSVSDAIYLAGKRAELLLNFTTPNTHAMLSVRASAGDIQRLAEGHPYEVACLNGTTDTVISGTESQIALARTALENNGLKCHLLDIPYAFHSDQLDPILDEFEELASHLFFKSPSVPVISPLLGHCIFDDKTINANYLRHASRQPVNFIGALQAGREMGMIDDQTVWVDIGHHPICSTFLRNHNPGAKVFPSLHRTQENFATISGTLAGLHCEGMTICWNEYFRPFEMSHSLLQLSQYHWNQKNYWITYEGTWTLDKAHPRVACSKSTKHLPQYGASLKSSSVQRIIFEHFEGTIGRLTAVSDIRSPELLGAVKGHLINGHGVVSASIWTDMALTVGEYLYKGVSAGKRNLTMNVTEMLVSHAQILNKDTKQPQLIQIEATIDLGAGRTAIQWYTCSADGDRSEDAFASAAVQYEDSKSWQRQWQRTNHLLNDRIESLSRMALDGPSNRLSKSMIYTLFGNIVDYAERYRGMQSVVLNGYEAYADIVLDTERHGNWHTPPHWIDSVFQLAGFVMNGSDAANTKEYFCVTPGWAEYRLVVPLEAGGRYRSYVRMFPDSNDPNVFTGDVVASRDGVVIGVCGQIKFKRVSRVLMDHLFVAPDAQKSPNSSSHSVKLPTKSPVHVPTEAIQEPSESETRAKIRDDSAMVKEHSIIADCFRLIARESGSWIEEFVEDASFVELGIDSLMSLVVAEKFRTELGVEIRSSIFLEFPTVKELKGYLAQYF